MNHSWMALLAALCLTSCSSYDPLAKKNGMYPGPMKARSAPGIKVTFLGNSTLSISDGTTHLLVDGFVSRPGIFETFLSRIEPDEKLIRETLGKAGITKLNAVLVGHTHFDHALDAPLIAKKYGCPVMGTKSYANVHEGAGAPTGDKLITVPPCGGHKEFGDFTVTFSPSDHVASHLLTQKFIEGSIDKPLKTPAYFTRFNCGDVFVIHIAHPHGNMVVTTTAGAKEGQLNGKKADVVFLGTGFLGKRPCHERGLYWRETVGATMPERGEVQTVIPIHWDNFYKKLPDLKVPPLLFVDDTEAAMNFIKARAKCSGCKVQTMGAYDSVLLRRGKIEYDLRETTPPEAGGPLSSKRTEGERRQ